MKRDRGFTLIELVAVMVILAILAVVAIPQFVDLRTEARAAAQAGVGGALSSASTLNYALRSANGGGQAVANCSTAANLLQSPLPTGYSITALAAPANTATSCDLVGPAGTTTFSVIGIP